MVKAAERSRPKRPTSRAAWQAAVDAAAACRIIWDAAEYGLITLGGRQIDVARCDRILEEGARRGFHPAGPPAQLAAGMIQQWNATKT